MSGLTTYTSQGVLGHITGKTAIFALRTAYVALFSAAGADDGTGFTEIAGGAYARVPTAPADWSAPSSAAPSVISNANPIIFPTSTAAWGNVTAFGVYDAATAGNLLAWDFFGAFTWLPCSIVAASPGVFTSPRHAFLNGDTVMYSTEYGGTPPTFSQGNLTGPLIVANSLTDTFTVTNGGVVVNTATSGDGNVRKVATQAIISNVQATFPANALNITLA
jgi:hypothetical protein